MVEPHVPRKSEKMQKATENLPVADSPTFREWRDQLPAFELDGETLFLPTGDIPMSEDELVEYWQRLTTPPKSEGDERGQNESPR